MAGTHRIGEIFVRRGLIRRADADALEGTRDPVKLRYASHAVALRHVDARSALLCLEEQTGFPAVDLTRAVVPRGEIVRVPMEVARAALVLPLRLEGAHLLIATADPRNRALLEELQFATGLELLPHVALQGHLQEAIPLAHATTSPFFVGANADAGMGDERGYVPRVAAADADPGIDLGIDVALPEAMDELDAGGVTAGADAGQSTVLVVDDDPVVQQMVASTLRTLGCRVLTADRGLVALRLVKQHSPDLIVLDAMLPEIHGFEICRKVKESKRFGATPVLMMSALYRGWRIAEDVKSTYRADGFLEKPFRIAELRDAAERLLRRAPTPTRSSAALNSTARDLYAAAQAEFRAGRMDGALELLRRAQEADPFAPQVQMALGVTLQKSGQAFLAIYHYERALELDPALYLAAQNLAGLYQGKGFHNKAVEMWQRCLKLAPSPEVRDKIRGHLVSIL